MVIVVPNIIVPPEIPRLFDDLLRNHSGTTTFLSC